MKSTSRTRTRLGQLQNRLRLEPCRASRMRRPRRSNSLLSRRLSLPSTLTRIAPLFLFLPPPRASTSSTQASIQSRCMTIPMSATGILSPLSTGSAPPKSKRFLCEAVSAESSILHASWWYLRPRCESFGLLSPSDDMDEERRVGQVHTLVLDAHVMIASRRWREGAPGTTTTNGLQVSSLFLPSIMVIGTQHSLIHWTGKAGGEAYMKTLGEVAWQESLAT